MNYLIATVLVVPYLYISMEAFWRQRCVQPTLRVKKANAMRGSLKGTGNREHF